MNEMALSEELENGSKEIKPEEMEPADIKLEALHESIDIKEETSIDDSQMYQDGEELNCEFEDCDMDEEANNTPLDSYPEKSKARYEGTYKMFKKWFSEKNFISIDEEVLLTYLTERSKKLKSPSSLWCEFSMLKTAIHINDNENISKYFKVLAFLKMKNVGYRSQKSKVFTRNEMNSFLSDAPDDNYLLMKVAMILGIAGACRSNELVNLRNEHVEVKQNFVVVNIPNAKVPRKFTVVDSKEHKVAFLRIIKKYIAIKSKSCNVSNEKNARFFVRYEKGRFISQPVGKNTFYRMPSVIATYLDLPNPKLYTGHAFRGTSTTILANAGVDVLNLIRPEKLKYSPIAENSIHQDVKTADNIFNSDASTSTSTSIFDEFKEVPILDNNPSMSTSTSTSSEFQQQPINETSTIYNKVSENCINISSNGSNQNNLISLSNCTNCTFTIIGK